MTALSLDQLAYLAAKAPLPNKPVLDAGKERVERFLDAWKEGRAMQQISPKVVWAINDLLGRIPLVGEVRRGSS